MTTAAYLLFAVLCGVVEAILYCRRGAESFRWNEHVVLVLQRGAVALVAGAALLDKKPGWVAVQFLAIGAMFSFFHNNAYNFARRWIDVQSFRLACAGFDWNYQSATSTARFDFDGPERNVLALIGVVILIVGWVTTH